MELELLSEQVEWEARMVAAAFEVAKWDRKDDVDSWVFWGSTSNSVHVLCSIDKRLGSWKRIGVGQEPDEASFEMGLIRRTAQIGVGNASCNTILTRGLYSQGFEGHELWREFDVTFSSHEKLELRLNLPREFWPSKWLDEEGEK